MGKRLRKHLRELRKLLTNEDFEVLSIKMTGSGHCSILLSKDDFETVLTVPSTASDHRCFKNVIKDAHHNIDAQKRASEALDKKSGMGEGNLRPYE